MPTVFTSAQRQAYDKDGFVMIPSLFDAEEISLMRQAMEQDPALKQSLYERRDAQGKATRIALWNEPGDSVYGLAARSERVADTIEDMLGAEVYHYHSKLTAKEPFDGGAWEWHQDYGYWYHNGCLFPHMASVMVALDRADRHNGCLQVIRGSHQAGRINHSTGPGEQVGAEMERVNQMLNEMDLVYAEMAPGDGLFFHSNVMHRQRAPGSMTAIWVWQRNRRRGRRLAGRLQSGPTNTDSYKNNSWLRK